MPAYAAAIPRPPRTLTELEQATLLKVTGEHRDGFRPGCVRVWTAAFSPRADRVSPPGRHPGFACTWTPRAPTIPQQPVPPDAQSA